MPNTFILVTTSAKGADQCPDKQESQTHGDLVIWKLAFAFPDSQPRVDMLD